MLDFYVLLCGRMQDNRWDEAWQESRADCRCDHCRVSGSAPGLSIVLLKGSGVTSDHEQPSVLSLYSHYSGRLTGRTTADHQTGAAILFKHNVDFLRWGGTAQHTPPICHSTHFRLGATSTAYYFNKPLNPSAPLQMKETDAEKMFEREKLDVWWMTGSASPWLMGAFGASLPLSFSFWGSYHGIFPTTDQLEPFSTTLNHILQPVLVQECYNHCLLFRLYCVLMSVNQKYVLLRNEMQLMCWPLINNCDLWKCSFCVSLFWGGIIIITKSKMKLTVCYRTLFSPTPNILLLPHDSSWDQHSLSDKHCSQSKIIGQMWIKLFSLLSLSLLDSVWQQQSNTF